VYPTTLILHGFARVSIKNEGIQEINYGNCIAASRPDRITVVTHWKVCSNNKNAVYPTTNILNGVARVAIYVKELKKLIMEFVSQLHAPTALPPELY
jgi:hypothetical protein